MNLFEFTFIYDVRFRSSFIFITCGYSVAPETLVETTVLPPLNCFCNFVKIHVAKPGQVGERWPFLSSLQCFTDLCVCPSPA